MKEVLEQPNYHTMNNCLIRIQMTQGKQFTINKITDNVEIANYFNSFFTNISKDFANKIKDDSNKNYSYYLLLIVT